MEEFPIDHGAFHIIGPVWVLECNAGGKVGYAGGRTSKARYLYVFTDLHRAEQYLEGGGAPNFVPRQLPSEAAYASFLEAVQSGFDRVVYDQPAQGRVRVSFAIAEVIKDARRSSGQAES
jgi:hypothetical protein